MMKFSIRVCLCAIVAGLAPALAGLPAGAAPQARPQITQAIDDTALTSLEGNTRPEAAPENDRGRVAETLPLNHMTLQLRRTPEQEAALDRLIDELHDPASPHYHHWLNAAQVGSEFGPADEDLTTLKNWLSRQGFRVNFVHADRMAIDFSGTAGQVRTAFHTELHQLDVHGDRHLANMTDPRIPRALAPVVAGVVSLNDFRPRPQSSLGKPSFAACSTFTCEPVLPADLATIYNFNPLFKHGITGKGQTIAAINISDAASLADWTTFRKTYGFLSYAGGTLTQVHPQPASGFSNCGDPGVGSEALEAILDSEWASAAAPDAHILLATCKGTTTQDGILTAVVNLEEQSSAVRPQIISISYGECEAFLGAAVNAAYKNAFQTAVIEGISIFSASGDQLSATCDPKGAGGSLHGPAVSGVASTPYNVAVGSTDFSDTYHNTVKTYWTGPTFVAYGAAKSYIPEIPWNAACSNALISKAEGFSVGDASLCNNPVVVSLGLNRLNGSGGGRSGCAMGAPSSPGVVSGSCSGYAKPTWQKGVRGLQPGGTRSYPDVSIFGANSPWRHSYVICAASLGGCRPGYGGTSFSTPIMAGVQALVNQKLKATTGEGNPNVAYYKLAAAEYNQPDTRASCNSKNGREIGKSCVFHDVTEGDIATFCFTDLPGCGGYGFILYGLIQPVYTAKVGWDFASGLGSVNVTNLVNAWHTVEP